MFGVGLVIVYCILVGVASFAGGMLTSWTRLTHTRMQAIMSFVGGMVLGVGLLHLIPHSAAETRSLDHTVLAALAGLLGMFLLIRAFHVHQHGPVELTPEPPAAAECHHEHDAAHGHCHSHACAGPEAHDYPLDGEHCATHRRPYSWIGLWVGLTLHTLIDGMALAAAVSAAEHAEAPGFAFLGLGTFLAVLLHKPLDAMSIMSVMAAGGSSLRAQRTVNIVFATMCALGAVGFYLGLERFAEHQQMLVGLALGFAGGVFLCISLADILPEVQFHAHDRLKLSGALLLGVALAYAIGFIEPGHQHGGDPDHDHHAAAHDHE